MKRLNGNKRICALFMAVVLSLQGLSVGSVTAGAESVKTYPPNYEKKVWNVKHEDGTYVNHIPYDGSGVLLVMPGESLEFEEYIKTTSSLISGTTINSTTTMKTAGMVILDDCSNLPDGETASFTASGQINEKTDRIDDRPENAQHDTITLEDGYTSFINNTEYAAYLSYKGVHEKIDGYHYDSNGYLIEQTSISTIEYMAIWYPVEWNITWDAKHLGLVEDATFQGIENEPSKIYPKWYGGNNSYDITVTNPVSAGRHFTCWTVSPANCGFDNPSEIRKGTDNGMSETTISYTAGKYVPTVDGEVVTELTFISNWEDNYTITYHAGEGTLYGQSDWIYEALYEDGSYSAAGLTTLPEREGYNFDGWYYKNSEGKEVTFTNLNDTPYPDWDGTLKGRKAEELNLDVYAKWSVKSSAPKTEDKVAATTDAKTDQTDNSDKSINEASETNSNASGSKTVEVAYSPSKAEKKKKTITVPDTVTLKDGTVAKVTSISANAFKNNKKLTQIIIGKNVKKIGSKAFYNCKNLKKITIKTTKLTKKTVGKNAFKKINAKAKIKVPKKKLKTYKKILKARGITGKKQKISA